MPGQISGPTCEGDRCCSKIPLERNGSLGQRARHTFQVSMPRLCLAPQRDVPLHRAEPGSDSSPSTSSCPPGRARAWSRHHALAASLRHAHSRSLLPAAAFHSRAAAKPLQAGGSPWGIRCSLDPSTSLAHERCWPRAVLVAGRACPVRAAQLSRDAPCAGSAPQPGPAVASEASRSA